MSTESRHPRSIGLDKMSAREIVRLMNEDDQIILRVMREAEARIAEVAERAAETYKRGGRIIYVGSGTSGRIAQMDAAEMTPTFGIPRDRFIVLMSGGTDLAGSVENAEDDTHAAVEALNQIGANRNDLLIAVAASGRTPYVLSAVRHAKQKGVYTVGLVSNPKSPLMQMVDYPILLDTGPEILTGSTRLKAGTAQKMALNRISTAAMVLCGKVIENLMVDIKPSNSKLKERCVNIVRELTGVTEHEAVEMLDAHGWNIREVIEAARATRVAP